MTLYQRIISVYKILPFKKVICQLLKMFSLPLEKFYRDLKFKGEYKVDVDSTHSFQLYHYGGTIENEIFWKGLHVSFEPEMLPLWIHLCKEASVIFDIGANTGVYSLVAKVLNSDSVIYAFEPSVNTYDKVRNNIKLNNMDVICNQIALSDVDGKAIFYDFNDSHQTSASLSADMYRNDAEKVDEFFEYEVQTQTLDSFIEERAISKIDLMKIDVEMHEPAVVRGFVKNIAKFKPTIFIEVLSDDVAYQLNDLLGEQYIIFHLKNDCVLNRVPKFTRQLNEWNYLIVHKDKYKKFIEDPFIN